MKLSPDKEIRSWFEEGPKEVDTFIDAIKVVKILIIQINLN
jgi:hypothetical protein